MIKRWLIKDFIGWCLIALLFFSFASCSPQKRLSRLIKNNPELVTTDTIYSAKTFTVPGYYLDTNFKANTDVYGVSELIEVYKDYLDSVKRAKLTNEIKTYIINRECLKDTFKVSLNNNGYCKLWQKAGVFFYQLHQPPQKFNFSVPVSINSVTAIVKHDWKYFWIGVSTAFAFILILLAVLNWIKPIKKAAP